MALKIYNSHTNNYETEEVPAELFLKFLYSNAVGKLALWALIKRKIFSKIFGVWANSKISKNAGPKFAKAHSINLDDCPKKKFANFNDFFARELLPEARVPKGGEDCAFFPADSRNLAAQNIGENYSFYAKGQKLDIAQLLGCAECAKLFTGGSILISRLSPVDYHRFHYPISGTIEARKRIKGHLNSVSPIALCRGLKYLLQNERVVNILRHKSGAYCAVVQIGATNVGSIVNFDKISANVKAAAQMGKFLFGGSCVVCVFQKDFVEFAPKLLECSAKNIEYYAHVGDVCGKIVAGKQ